MLIDISSQKEVIRYHQQYQSMPQDDVAFFEAFMSIYAPDDVGVWAKAKLRITQGIQKQGGTSLFALGGSLVTMKDCCHMAKSAGGVFVWSRIRDQLFELCTAMSAAQSTLPQHCRQYNQLFLDMRARVAAKPADGHPAKEDLDAIIHLCDTAMQDLSLESGKH